MKNLIAIGKKTHGETYGFDCSDGHLYCWGNQLTELTIPEGVIYVSCYRNQLTELKLPEGVKEVNCRDNKITHLDLPDSVIELYCDKEVTGLEKHVGKVKMELN